MATHSITGNSLLYACFKPKERLVLLLEAMARGDEPEVLKLHHSCPRSTYSGPDLAFEERYHLALDTTAIVCGDLSALTAQLRMVHWSLEAVAYCSTLHHINCSMAFLEGVRCAQGLSQCHYFKPQQLGAAADGQDQAIPSLDEDQEEEDLSCLGQDIPKRMEAVELRAEHATQLMLGVLGRSALDVARELNSVWEAFDGFCHSRVGLSPHLLLQACGYPVQEELEELLKRYAAVQADPSHVSQYQQSLCGVWDRLLQEK